MAVDLSAALVSQLQQGCPAFVVVDGLHAAVDPAIKHHVEHAWHNAALFAPGSSDELARSTLELVGRELLWNAAVRFEPIQLVENC